MNQGFKDYYAILKVPREASPAELKRAYRKRMKLYHPDKWEDDPEQRSIAAEDAKDINEAWEVLKDPVTRSEYDVLWLQFQAGPSAFQAAMEYEEERDAARAKLVNVQHKLRESQTTNARLQQELNRTHVQMDELRAKQKQAGEGNDSATDSAQWKAMAESYEAQIQALLKELQPGATGAPETDLREEKGPQTQSRSVSSPKRRVTATSRPLRFGVALAVMSVVSLIVALTVYRTGAATRAAGSVTSIYPAAITAEASPTRPDSSMSAMLVPTRIANAPTSTPVMASSVTSVDVDVALISTPTVYPTAVVTSSPSATNTRVPPTRTATPTVLSPATSWVLAERLNVRSGPGTIYPVVASLKRGDSFLISGKDREVPSWWFVKLNAALSGWVSADPALVTATNTSSISLVAAPPTPKPTPTRAVASTLPTIDAHSQPAPSAAVSGGWVLIADSASNFPDSRPERQWWYLYSDGRNNFRWREMDRQEQGCQSAPSEHMGRICADSATTDASGDIALQWKARRGGKYLLEWDVRIKSGSGEALIYKHANQIASQGPGLSLPNSYVDEAVIDWEMFFFVVRADYGAPPEAALHVRVYRWE